MIREFWLRNCIDTKKKISVWHGVMYLIVHQHEYEYFGINLRLGNSKLSTCSGYCHTINLLFKYVEAIKCFSSRCISISMYGITQSSIKFPKKPFVNSTFFLSSKRFATQNVIYLNIRFWQFLYQILKQLLFI